MNTSSSNINTLMQPVSSIVYLHTKNHIQLLVELRSVGKWRCEQRHRNRWPLNLALNNQIEKSLRSACFWNGTLSGYLKRRRYERGPSNWKLIPRLNERSQRWLNGEMACINEWKRKGVACGLANFGYQFMYRCYVGKFTASGSFRRVFLLLGLRQVTWIKTKRKVDKSGRSGALKQRKLGNNCSTAGTGDLGALPINESSSAL